MSDLGLNKYLGAGLATALGLMALVQLPGVVFGGGGGGHHGDDHGEATTLSQQMCSRFSYCVEIAEAAAAATGPAEVYDLGMMMLSAEATIGQRVFNGQCLTCHSIEAGGANGTGPNLYNVVGAEKAAHAGFNYSGALAAADGNWSYENLDAWLKNPAAYVKGTSMSFAGVRRDGDRASLIAYLAANTENPPPFPAPLEAAAPADAEPAIESVAVPTEGEGAPVDGAAPADGTAPAPEEAVPTPEPETQPT